MQTRQKKLLYLNQKILTILIPDILDTAHWVSFVQ